MEVKAVMMRKACSVHQEIRNSLRLLSKRYKALRPNRRWKDATIVSQISGVRECTLNVCGVGQDSPLVTR
jgi:hypothetical protein